MNKNLLRRSYRQIEMIQKHRCLVARIFIESNLSNPQHARPIEKFGNHRNDFPRKRNVLRLLRVDTQPREMLDSVPGRPFRFEANQLLEIIAKTIDASSVVP